MIHHCVDVGRSWLAGYCRSCTLPTKYDPVIEHAIGKVGVLRLREPIRNESIHSAQEDRGTEIAQTGQDRRNRWDESADAGIMTNNSCRYPRSCLDRSGQR